MRSTKFKLANIHYDPRAILYQFPKNPMMSTKAQQKKVLRKQIRAQHAITADTQIPCSNAPTECLVICNAGLATGLQLERLLAAASAHGAIRAAHMLPGKSYCFLLAASPADAVAIFNAMHGSSRLGQNDTVLYMSYCERVPQLASTWDGPLPEGLAVLEDFVSEAEEAELLAACGETEDAEVANVQPEAATNQLKHRRVRHFGYAFQYGSNNVDRSQPLLQQPIPAECQRLWSRFNELPHSGVPQPFAPDQLTLNAYASGQGIPPHCDTHSPFEEPIVSLSLCSGVCMEFRQPATGEQRSVWLPRRSLLVMRGAARFGWTHGITPRRQDVVPLELGEEGGGAVGAALTVRERPPRRVSLTFRQLRREAERCQCAHPELCDTAAESNAAAQAEDSGAGEQQPAAELERRNVHAVYEQIAGHFSETRHSPWPLVLGFVRSLPNGAVLVDVGCGNGKYLVPEAAQQQQQQRLLLKLGCDRSAGLLAVCGDRGLNVFRCDCLRLPMRDGCADGCICIAVVHHLATEDRRLQALREIARVLRPGGQALVYVWAKNQAKDAQQSSYLRQRRGNRGKEVASGRDEPVEPVVRVVDGLPVHTNRTQFAAQDMLVPWKLKAPPAAEAQPEQQQQFLRFYHVFEEGELEALVGRVEGVRVVRGYYDQGNWCVVFERLAETN